jgi:hypothetical protein
VKSELRHNRVPIATEEDYDSGDSGKAIVAYIETLADNRVGGYGHCLVAFRFSLVVPQIVRIAVTQEVRWEKIEFCRRWGTMTASVSDIQPTLNNAFRDITSQCITEYLGE